MSFGANLLIYHLVSTVTDIMQRHAAR